ncbi:MAG: outer membrane protein assembly factor BamA [Myxococcales bacterium FL481]|nr:MAG: outer membrane protein assembly factor BamA [Myxococcales bacterium FL481]
MSQIVPSFGATIPRRRPSAVVATHHCRRPAAVSLSRGRQRRASVRALWALFLLVVSVGLQPASAQAANQIPGPRLSSLLIAEDPDAIYGQPIAEIRFKGNRRVESEAMLLELDSAPSELVSRLKLAADVHKLWALGYFDDVRIEGELTPAGVVLTYVVKERPTVRKIILEGNSKIKLDDVNAVLDLAANEVLDLGKVKANVEKVKSLYTEEGFFLAEVSYVLRPVDDETGKVDVVIVVDEAAEVIVREITFVGNKAFRDHELRKFMLTRTGSYLSVITKQAGGVYNRDAFTQDYTNLRSYYMDKGYLEADVGDAELALSPDRRFAHVTIPLTEGPLFHIGEIRAKEVVPRGEEQLFSEEVLQEIIEPHLKVGDVASVGKLNEVRQAIENRYKNSGHAYVNVIPNQRFDRENLKLYTVLEVQKGPLVYIERVNIYGHDRTSDKVIRREIPLKEGDLYSETGKNAAEYRVLRLGFFEEANVSTSRGSDDDKIELNVEVTERRTGSFQVGAGFSTVERFVLQAQISYDNFRGQGSSLSLVAQMSGFRQLFNFRYFTRYFLDTKWNFVFSLFRSVNAFRNFSRASTGATFEWGYPVPKMPDLSLWAGYEIEDVRADDTGGVGAGGAGGIFNPGGQVTSTGQQMISNLFANGITSAATARVQYDSRDNLLFPTSGQFHSLQGQFATKYLGSQNRYNRYLLRTRFYFPVIRTDRSFRAWLVFRSQLQVGYVHSNTRKGVPVFERWFAGGVFGHGQIRGFQMRGLGPKIKVQDGPAPTDPLRSTDVGGNLLTALNLELEFMMVPPANIKGVLFFDTGNTFNTEALYCTEPDPVQLPKSDPCANFRFRNLRASVGWGLRWRSPIGPLRFEWGIPIDRQPRTAFVAADQPIVFEFNVGTGF